jgi:LysM repeat protein
MDSFDRRTGFVNRLWLLVALGLTLAVMLALAESIASAEPTEEDLPPAPAAHTSVTTSSDEPNSANPDNSATAPSPQSVSPSDASGTDNGTSDTSASATRGTSREGGEEGAASANQPHRVANYFPYTIRPGDSLYSIGNLFGVDSSVIAHVNHIDEDNPDLIAGHTLRIPNPYLAKMRDLEGQVDRLSAERAEIDQRAASAQTQLTNVQAEVQELSGSNRELRREVVVLPWWRAASYLALLGALLMFGVMVVALFEWLTLRGRFRAVAEMNEALRRLDYRYRGAVAKAELRLQELYGRRRRGLQDGHDRPRIPEDAELERLHQQLKEILETHLARLGPPGERARRARWRELMGGIGAPAEARSARR